MLSKLTTKNFGKGLKLMVISAMFVALLAACGKDEVNPSLMFKGVEDGEVIATYKDGTVTDKEFNKFKSGIALLQGMDEALLDQSEYREAFLEQYITYKILANRTTEEQQATSKEEALASFEQTKEGLAAYGEVKDMLKEKNLTENDLASLIMIAVTANTYIQSQITDEMLKEEYDGNKDDYTLYNGRQIIVKNSVTDATTQEVTVTRTDEEALARAKEVQAKLVAGGDWEELAAQYSDDATTKATGGVFKDYMGGYWMEEIKTAAFTLPLNEVSEPIKSSVGYNVLKVEARDVLEFDAIADATKEMIRNVLSNTVTTDFVNEELPGYEINITLPEVEAPEGDATTPTATPEGDAATPTATPAS